MTMDQIQVQVQIGETRRVFFTASPRTYNDLTEAIKREIPKTRDLTFGLLYENDEKEYVVMNSDPLCFRVAITGIKCIPGTDIHRLKLRVFEGSSPSVKAKVDSRAQVEEVTDSHCRQPQSKSALRRYPTSSTVKSCLVSNFMGCEDIDSDDTEEDRMIMGLDNDSDDRLDNDLCVEKTPLERYITKSEEKIDEQETVIRQLQANIENVEKKLARVKSDPNNGNICRNCHLRLGHTARNCQLDKCTSVFKCGLEKNHPGEHKLKEMRSQLKQHEIKLKQLREELRNRKHAVENATDKKHVRIESELLQANRAAYMVNGNQNWSLLRKHVYLVQEYCKKNLGGKIPARHDIGRILNVALGLADDDSSNNQFYSRSKQNTKRRKHENPARSSLEHHGIEFPSSRLVSTQSSSSCSNSISFDTDKEKPSQILHSAPASEEEEAEQLAIVIRESLHKSKPQTLESANTNLSYPTPQSTYAPTGFDLPMAYGNMYTPMAMPSLASICPYFPSYSPMAMPYTQSTGDCVRTTTSTPTNSFMTPAPAESTSDDVPEVSENDAVSMLLNLSSQNN